MAFFIEKIVASGAGKKESTIVFKPGANIIYGPSNTGKTYIVKCIDFLFGSDADPFDSSSGYDSISIYLKTRGGQVVMHRKLGSNKIDVSSTDPSIHADKLYAKSVEAAADQKTFPVCTCSVREKTNSESTKSTV